MVNSRMALTCLLVGASLALAAQTPPPATPRGSALEAGPKGSDDAPGTVLRLDVRRVPLDIVVTDREGNPVRGLTQSDFIVNEDKKPQTILSFDYEDGSTSSYTPGKLPVLPANTFANLPTQPERGPLYILYYDMVNTDTDNQMSAHQQLLDFVDHSQPGTRFALFVNAAGLHLIQGFTSDRALLRAAILAKGPGPHLPDVFLYGSIYGNSDAGAALQCLKFIADYVNGIPGRKNLFWLSSTAGGGFPIPTGATLGAPNTAAGIGGGFSSTTPQINDLTYLLSENIKKTYAAMMRSQVALYPIDLKGVPGSITDYLHMDDIAAATGGHAYYANNRVMQLLDKAVQNGESYYTLSYAPKNAKYDGSERHVEVTLASPRREKYTLSYRTSYYALDDDQLQQLNKKDRLQARFMAATTTDTLYANMEHGAPMLHDLLFSTHLATEGTPQKATGAQMAELEDSPAYFRTRRKNGAPPKPLAPVALQKYRIRYGIANSQLNPLGSRGGKPAELVEFVAAAYDADGRLLNSIISKDRAVPQTAHDGKAQPFFAADQELDVPPGAMWLRLAVRDTATNRTGTLEVRLPLKPETAKTMGDKAN